MTFSRFLKSHYKTLLLVLLTIFVLLFSTLSYHFFKENKILRKNNTTLSKTIEDNNSTIKNKATEIDRQATEINSLKIANTTLTSEKENAKSKIATLELEAKWYDVQMNELEAQLKLSKNSVETIKTLKSKIKFLRTQKQQLLMKIDELAQFAKSFEKKPATQQKKPVAKAKKTS